MVTRVITTIGPAIGMDRRLIVLATAIAVAVALPLVLRAHVPDPQAIASAGYAALFVAGFLSGATLVLPMPVLPLVFSSASMFNPGLVTITAAAGMALGMGVTYFMGAWVRDHVNWRVATRADRVGLLTRILGGWFSKSCTLCAFVLAAVPNPVYDFAGIIAGSARAPFGGFMLGITLGKLAQTLAVAMSGYYATHIPWLG
jgi:membrane protein YqaA with SNARE-associated domain